MQWDLYCRVIDNFGDVGVAWRLAADLAGRGETVRLALDDASALAWMAPRGAPGIEVVSWHEGPSAAPDAVVELFGAGRPVPAWPVGTEAPVLINLEHLSAEAYVERSHGLASPVARPGEPTTTTWFFYPGFTPATGGLLREPGLLERRGAFGTGDEWLRSIGIEPRPGESRVSLFCYGNAPVEALIAALDDRPTLLLLAPGAAGERAAAALGAGLSRGRLRALRLPLLDQREFDLLLWSCDLNFVRGEDSFVRAMWAGVPFVWQAYVQEDGAHARKVESFLGRFLAGGAEPVAQRVRSLFGRWNGPAGSSFDAATMLAEGDPGWSAACERWRDALAAQEDLVTRLVRFVESKR